MMKKMMVLLFNCLILFSISTEVSAMLLRVLRSSRRSTIQRNQMSQRRRFSSTQDAGFTGNQGVKDLEEHLKLLSDRNYMLIREEASCEMMHNKNRQDFDAIPWWKKLTPDFAKIRTNHFRDQQSLATAYVSADFERRRVLRDIKQVTEILEKLKKEISAKDIIILQQSQQIEKLNNVKKE